MESVCFEKFCGQIVKKEQINEIIEIIETFPKLSRTEIVSGRIGVIACIVK